MRRLASAAAQEVQPGLRDLNNMFVVSLREAERGWSHMGPIKANKVNCGWPSPFTAVMDGSLVMWRFLPFFLYLTRGPAAEKMLSVSHWCTRSESDFPQQKEFVVFELRSVIIGMKWIKWKWSVQEQISILFTHICIFFNRPLKSSPEKAEPRFNVSRSLLINFYIFPPNHHFCPAMKHL